MSKVGLSVIGWLACLIQGCLSLSLSFARRLLARSLSCLCAPSLGFHSRQLYSTQALCQRQASRALELATSTSSIINSP